MSLKSWKAEFYPKAPSKRMSAKDAIAHSIRKWTGVSKANCRKHQVVYENHWVAEQGDDLLGMLFASESCALCVKYFDSSFLTPISACVVCPIVKVTGDTCNNAWFNSDRQPGEMLKLLRNVQRKVVKLV